MYSVQARKIKILVQKLVDVIFSQNGNVLAADYGRQRVEGRERYGVKDDLLVAMCIGVLR